MLSTNHKHTIINSIALLLASGWFILIGLTLDPAIDDFERYWQASVDLLRYGDPYVTRSDYFYPPFFVYLIQPFGLLSHQQGQWLWFSLNSMALAGFIALCIQMSGSTLAHRYWGVVVLGMVIVPFTRLSLQLGQVSIMIALMLVGSMAFARRQATATAGTLLALASLVRLNPAFVGIYYLLRGPRRVAWWSIGAGSGLLALSVLIYGFKHYNRYGATIVQANIAQQGAYPYAAEHNISLFGFWYRFLTVNPHSIPIADAPTLARTLVGVCSLIVFALCLLVIPQSAEYMNRTKHTTGQPAEEEDKYDTLLRFSVWLCGMMILWPTNGYYNLVIVLLPVLLVVRLLEQMIGHETEHQQSRAIRVWLVISVALMCIPPGWSKALPVLYTHLHIGWGTLLLTPALYGVCLLMGVLVWLVVARQHIIPSSGTEVDSRKDATSAKTGQRLDSL